MVLKMQFLCFVLLLCGFPEALSLPNDDLATEKSEENCVANCQFDLGQSFDNVSPELAKLLDMEQNDTEYWVAYSKNAFVEKCVLFQTFLKCVENCPPSPAKTWQETLNRDERFICVDRFEELSKNFECWQKADNATRNGCGCREPLQAEINFNKADDKVYDTCDFPSYKKSLDDFCNQLVCRHACEIKTTEGFCGENLSKWIVNDAVGLEFNGIRDSLAMINRSEYWPAGCTELLKATGYDKASPVKDTFIVC